MGIWLSLAIIFKLSFLSTNWGDTSSTTMKNINIFRLQGDTIEEWSPFNADLHMQGIKVMVKEPVPLKIQKGDAFEDTMLLLEMMKEKKQREKKQQREDLIRAMAMEKKRKLGMGNQSNNQYLKLTF